MSKTSTSQELIDGVFSEIYVKSRIVINCHCGTDPDMFSGEVPLEIETVNRCETPEAFGDQYVLRRKNGKSLMTKLPEKHTGNPQRVRKR